MIKNISTLEIKIKADDLVEDNFPKKLQDLRVNYMTIKSLALFAIDNDNEEPIIAICAPVDEDHSKFDIEDDVVLRDNECYNIYYSINIYEVGKEREDINEENIGEFYYIDSNLLENSIILIQIYQMKYIIKLIHSILIMEM